ncbi:stalk domain-containing protein [Acetivibrio cellulolyticus]|uniref:stalk domain-containing protein n=1 Tax=Acetivibrio cellulolyticus TaxID=35830 RepID=UPI0001E2E7E3|nr:stalk domain-containing protein [Acetivibrio cellulolyticus]
MKKFVIGLVLGSIITGTVGAAAQYVLTPITYNITVNGKTLQDEQYPILNWNGTTYLSLRKTTEAIGAKLFWNKDTKTAELTTIKTDNPPADATPNTTPNTTPNNGTTVDNKISSGSLLMKSDYIELSGEPVKYAINDSEYYIEFSRLAACTTSDANNYYIKIPNKGELTLPKQEGTDMIKANDSIIVYGDVVYVRISDLNFTTEIKDNVLWLK